jgi:cell division protein WhiA
MSFTSIVKNEVSKVEMLDSEKKSELIAILTNIATFSNKLNITTENASVARRVFTLIKDNYRFTPKVTVRKGYNFTKSYLYIIECPFTNEIKDDFGLISSSKIPEEYLVDDEEAIKAYLRGLFLAVGSINDPKTSRYHLEFLVDNKEYANFISNLLNTFSLNSKVLVREDTKIMIYVKEAEKISDFLRIISAISAILYFEDIRIYRDHKNMTNRLNNCEQANVDKIIATANEQLKDIEIINRVGGLDLLDDKLKEAAVYRQKYQDASLLELSEIISIETNKKITKSGLYHRFVKIKKIADQIKKNEE